MNKKASIAICILLLAYFMMTSGLVFEVTKCQTTGSINVPYSLALSAERTGILGIYTADDTACAEWLIENKGEIPLFADYNGCALLIGFHFWFEPMPRPTETHYLLLTTWNTQHKKMVIGACPGLRTYKPLPNLDSAVEVFRRGDAVVYRVAED